MLIDLVKSSGGHQGGQRTEVLDLLGEAEGPGLAQPGEGATLGHLTAACLYLWGGYPEDGDVWS